MSFYCKYCKYSTDHIGHMNRHNNTPKHDKNYKLYIEKQIQIDKSLNIENDVIHIKNKPEYKIERTEIYKRANELIEKYKENQIDLNKFFYCNYYIHYFEKLQDWELDDFIHELEYYSYLIV